MRLLLLVAAWGGDCHLGNRPQRQSRLGCTWLAISCLHQCLKSQMLTQSAEHMFARVPCSSVIICDTWRKFATNRIPRWSSTWGSPPAMAASQAAGDAAQAALRTVTAPLPLLLPASAVFGTVTSRLRSALQNQSHPILFRKVCQLVQPEAGVQARLCISLELCGFARLPPERSSPFGEAGASGLSSRTQQ